MPNASSLRATPLNSVHRALGAKMVDFGGWDMPVQYSGIIDEHHTVRSRVGLFDVSHMGEIEIRGPEALQLAEFVTTNQVGKLKRGQAHYSGLLYDHGGFVDDILVHKVADDHYFLCVNASNQEKDFDHIRQQNRFDAEVELASDRYTQLAIQGPHARATLQKLTPVDLEGIKYYWFADGEVAGTAARIAHTGYTGEDGFEIYIPPAESERIWNRVMEAGAEFGIKPCGLGARNTLRLEAKMALYGHEIDASISPLEADLGWIVKFDKGEFIGREALVAVQAAGGPGRKIIALEMIERGIARDGYPVLDLDGNQIGAVTSGSPAPFLKTNIALALVPVSVAAAGQVVLNQAAAGQELLVQVRANRVRARQVPFPFYKRAKK